MPWEKTTKGTEPLAAVAGQYSRAGTARDRLRSIQSQSMTRETVSEEFVSMTDAHACAGMAPAMNAAAQKWRRPLSKGAFVR